MLYKGGILKTSEKKKHDDENKVYEMYYNYQEKVKTLVSHRILAINRAEKEKVINVNIEGDKYYYLQYRQIIPQPTMKKPGIHQHPWTSS